METDKAVDDKPIVNLLLENDIFGKNVNLEKFKFLTISGTKEKLRQKKKINKLSEKLISQIEPGAV